MTSNHTDKYQLNQWEKSDKVLMEDFNGDNQKIEDALAGLAESKAEQSEVDGLSGQLASALLEVPRAAMGTYEGTGEYGTGKYTSVTFPFEPKLAVVMGSSIYAVFLAGNTAAWTHSGFRQGNLVVRWDGATMSWYIKSALWGSSSDNTSAALQMNSAGVTYQYLAIG